MSAPGVEAAREQRVLRKHPLHPPRRVFGVARSDSGLPAAAHAPPSRATQTRDRSGERTCHHVCAGETVGGSIFKRMNRLAPTPAVFASLPHPLFLGETVFRRDCVYYQRTKTRAYREHPTHAASSVAYVHRISSTTLLGSSSGGCTVSDQIEMLEDARARLNAAHSSMLARYPPAHRTAPCCCQCFQTRNPGPGVRGCCADTAAVQTLPSHNGIQNHLGAGAPAP